MGILSVPNLNVVALQLDRDGKKGREDGERGGEGRLPREGTPIHYLYGYVPPNGVVILDLLI